MRIAKCQVEGCDPDRATRTATGNGGVCPEGEKPCEARREATGEAGLCAGSLSCDIVSEGVELCRGTGRYVNSPGANCVYGAYAYVLR